jgi:hypothetical protein
MCMCMCMYVCLWMHYQELNLMYVPFLCLSLSPLICACTHICICLWQTIMQCLVSQKQKLCICVCWICMHACMYICMYVICMHVSMYLQKLYTIYWSPCGSTSDVHTQMHECARMLCCVHTCIVYVLYVYVK